MKYHEASKNLFQIQAIKCTIYDEATLQQEELTAYLTRYKEFYEASTVV